MSTVTVSVLGPAAAAAVAALAEMTVRDEASGTESGRLGCGRDLTLRLVAGASADAVAALCVGAEPPAGLPSVPLDGDPADRVAVKAGVLAALRAALAAVEAA